MPTGLTCRISVAAIAPEALKSRYGVSRFRARSSAARPRQKATGSREQHGDLLAGRSSDKSVGQRPPTTSRRSRRNLELLTVRGQAPTWFEYTTPKAIRQPRKGPHPAPASFREAVSRNAAAGANAAPTRRQES